jgi:hypothetical protein
MKIEHPSIQVETLAPGVHVITGHKPVVVHTEKGIFTPSEALHITPELPSEVLQAILDDRGDAPEPTFKAAGNFDSAINELEIKIGILENNIPIHEKEGNAEQVKVATETLESCRAALAALQSAKTIEPAGKKEVPPKDHIPEKANPKKGGKH